MHEILSYGNGEFTFKFFLRKLPYDFIRVFYITENLTISLEPIKNSRVWLLIPYLLTFSSQTMLRLSTSS